jgi:hypothetical protein
LIVRGRNLKIVGMVLAELRGFLVWFGPLIAYAGRNWGFGLNPRPGNLLLEQANTGFKRLPSLH